MSSHYERALLLYNSRRYEAAIPELQEAVAEDESDAYAHGLWALCLIELDRHQQALAMAKRAVELAPDSDYSFFVLSRVYLERSHLNEAFAAISTAIQLDPEDAMNHAWLARVEYERGNWNASVAAAEAGLALAAENDMCLHYRSLALTKLGRGDEARQDQEVLLAADPNDPHSHAARGWTLLEESEPEKAKEHFLEALRLDPSLDYARVGLANALKAKHFVFGLALRGLLYLDRFKTWVMWAFMIALIVSVRFLDRLAATNAAAVTPVLLLKAAFFTLIVLVIVAHPLFNLILRLDRDGRRALSPDEIRASNLHAVCLLAGLAVGLLWALQNRGLLAIYAYGTIALCGAITQTYQASLGWVRTRMGLLTILAAVILPASYVLSVVSAVMILKYKLPLGWLLKLAVFYLPLVSVCISGFADNIAEFLEKRRPDSLPDPYQF